MKNKAFLHLLLYPLSILTFSESPDQQNNISDCETQSSRRIFLYGEAHGVDEILAKELELWDEYYHNGGMRHLFIEKSYYSAAFLNMWMQSDNNDILDEIYEDWTGTPSYNLNVRMFYESIKKRYPKTIFHGTDIGHQYGTIGEQFLKYLRSNNLGDSEQYILAQEAIEQGKYFYEKDDGEHRENMMVGNFIREFDKLNGESVMGIYGASHTGLEDMNITNSVLCMANQLALHYRNIVHSEDLRAIPYKVDKIKVNNKEYEASYFGNQNMTSFSNEYVSRVFWRLENAYDDFNENLTTGGGIPYNNYLMPIKRGQIFVLDYLKIDGTIVRKYYRSSDEIWNDMLMTDEFITEWI